MPTWGARALAGAAVLALGLSGCGWPASGGSGQLVSQTRPVSGFDEVAVSHGATLVVRQTGQDRLEVHLTRGRGRAGR